MSQHSQLSAGSGFVPADGQSGNTHTGPALFNSVSRRPSKSAATIGVEPGSFLRRAILWKAFGLAEVTTEAPAGFLGRPIEADAVILHQLADPPAWNKLLDWAGNKTVVVDVEIAAAMAEAAGFKLRMQLAAGSVESALEVMCHQQNRTVFPQAPAVDIVALPPVATGFAPGDRVHLYCPSPIDPAIRVLADGPELVRFADAFKASIWGRESRTKGAALVSCPTPAGGLVTIMDLNTVDRKPEPNGSETPAIQILLSILGRSPVSFGRFVTPYPRYTDFIETLHELAARHSKLACLEKIGQSVEGRDLWLMKIARRPGLPVVLLSNAVHPYEWGPIYGVLRYVRFLLEQVEAGGFEADELLDTHQLWWVPSVCPDGFDNRQQQPSAINLNRNFPGGWEYAAPGQVHWGMYGRPPSIEELAPISLRGPAPASQPETRAMMSLFERTDGRIVTLADFHESTGTNNFLHQYEDENGIVPNADYHVELIEGISQSFSNRFFEQRDNSFLMMDQDREFRPGRICAWLGYAIRHGAKGCVVEASGGDCTHYRTIRRTEFAAQVVEQVLANETGRLYRNPWGEDQEVTMTLRRNPERVTCRLYDAAGHKIEETIEAKPAKITRTVPAGGCLRLRFG